MGLHNWFNENVWILIQIAQNIRAIWNVDTKPMAVGFYRTLYGMDIRYLSSEYYMRNVPRDLRDSDK